MPVSPTLARTAMPVRRRTAIVVAVVAAILLLTLAFVVPPLLNVDRHPPQAISYLQKKTGKQVEIGRLALTFFPLTVHIDHLGVKNPPIFPPGYVIQVARIDVGLSVRALLHQEVVIQSLVLDDPILNLTSDPDGPWNIRESSIKDLGEWSFSRLHCEGRNQTGAHNSV